MNFRIIGDQRQRGLDWAVPRLDAGTGHWDKASCLILEKDMEITAVVVYNHYYPEASVEISVAAVDGGRWLTRPFLSRVFQVPFLEWKMRRVGSSIAADNLKSIRFCAHCGFQQEGRIREGHGPGIDLLMFGMLRDECRWLGDTNGKTRPAGRARSGSDRQRADCLQ